MSPREVVKFIKHKSDFWFRTTKGRKFVDGDEWDWTRIDHVPAQILSHSEKLHFMLFKFYSYQIPRRKEKEQESSNVPALVARGLGFGPDSVTKGDFRKLSGLPRSTFGAKDRKVHGVCQLPEEYALCVVPSGAEAMNPRAVENLPALASSAPAIICRKCSPLFSRPYMLQLLSTR